MPETLKEGYEGEKEKGGGGGNSHVSDRTKLIRLQLRKSLRETAQLKRGKEKRKRRINTSASAGQTPINCCRRVGGGVGDASTQSER